MSLVVLGDQDSFLNVLCAVWRVFGSTELLARVVLEERDPFLTIMGALWRALGSTRLLALVVLEEHDPFLTVLGALWRVVGNPVYIVVGASGTLETGTILVRSRCAVAGP